MLKFGINIMMKMTESETIVKVWFEGDRIFILSSEGKEYSRPLEAFPLLKEASENERNDVSIVLHGTALRWEHLDEDIHISSFCQTEEPNEFNEVAAIFRQFPQLNVSEVARSMGINKSLLSKYIYGIKKPSPKRMMQIKEVLHVLGQRLVAV